MVSLKQKIEILESLDKVPFNYDRIPEYLEHTQIPEMAKPILKNILTKLTLLDTQITASYELTSEDDWQALFSNYETPLSQASLEIKHKIDLLSINFLKIFDELKKHSIEPVLDILSCIFKNKTRNIQFLLFKMAIMHPNAIFGYLISKAKKDPQIYVPFYCSLLVRLKFDEDLKIRCFSAFFKLISGLKMSKNIDYIVISQYLLYILCFNKDQLSKNVAIKDFVDRIFKSGLTSLMNRMVVDNFCDIFGYKCAVFHSFKNECLYFFPFDMPICKNIQDAIADEYVCFKK